MCVCVCVFPEDAQVPLCRGTARTCRALGCAAPLLDTGRANCVASLCLCLFVCVCVFVLRRVWNGLSLGL